MRQVDLSNPPEKINGNLIKKVIQNHLIGFTYEQLEAFMEKPGQKRPSFTLTSLWQPELEQPVRT